MNQSSNTSTSGDSAPIAQDPSQNVPSSTQDSVFTQAPQADNFQISEDVENSLVMDSELQTMGFSDEKATLEKMLSRPIILSSVPITWASSAPTLSKVLTFGFPQAFQDNRFMKCKMENFYALHADIDVEVKVNATPFHQGCLAIVALPPQQPLITTMEELSYYPHELISLPVTNSAKIRVPFLAEREAYEKFSTYWRIEGYVITPLRTANTTSVSLNAYAQLIEPELMIPIAQGAIPKAQGSHNARSKHHKQKRKPHKNHAKVSQQGEISDQTNTVTQITGYVADGLEAASSALSMIPIVNEIAPPLTWLARGANKVAAAFGWSKPVNVENILLNAPMPGARMANTHGVDNSQSLALYPDNAVDADNGYTELDEMDFSYIFERKFISDIFSLTPGQVFETIPLGTLPDNNVGAILSTFQNKRYNRKLEFNFIKTSFVTGRILIQYDYNNSINTRADALAAMTTVYTTMVDLTVENKAEITIPWMSLDPLSTTMPGRIIITDFNGIIAAETVSQTVHLVVYSSYTNVQVGCPVAMPKVIAQSLIEGNANSLTDDKLMLINTQSMVEYTQGENVTSLRELAKRFTEMEAVPLSTRHVSDYSKLENSLFGNINQMYAYRAGSIRFKIQFIGDPTQGYVKFLHSGNLTVDATPIVVFDTNMNSVVEFSVPFYSKTRRTATYAPWKNWEVVTDKQIAMRIYVAAGDDYNAMFLAGRSVQHQTHSDLPYLGTSLSSSTRGHGFIAPHLIKTGSSFIPDLTRWGFIGEFNDNGSLYQSYNPLPDSKGYFYNRDGSLAISNKTQNTYTLQAPFTNIMSEGFLIDGLLATGTHTNVSAAGSQWAETPITGVFADFGFTFDANYTVWRTQDAGENKYLIFNEVDKKYQVYYLTGTGLDYQGFFEAAVAGSLSKTVVDITAIPGTTLHTAGAGFFMPAGNTTSETFAVVNEGRYEGGHFYSDLTKLLLVPTSGACGCTYITFFNGQWTMSDFRSEGPYIQCGTSYTILQKQYPDFIQNLTWLIEPTQ